MAKESKHMTDEERQEHIKRMADVLCTLDVIELGWEYCCPVCLTRTNVTGTTPITIHYIEHSADCAYLSAIKMQEEIKDGR